MSYLYLFFIVLLASVSSSVQEEGCSASFRLNTYYDGDGPRYYYVNNDLEFTNTGSKSIISVRVNVALPPNGDMYFITAEDLNITSGEVHLSGAIAPGATKQAGRIVFSAQTEQLPYVELAEVLCASATPAPTATPTTTAPTAAPTTPAPTTAAPTTSAPTTAAPTTSAPTTAAPTTAAPTSAPSAASFPNVQLHASSNAWWLAVAVTNTQETITAVEFKDNQFYSSWKAMDSTNWGYWTLSPSAQLASTFSVRITSSKGASVVADFSSITPNMVVRAHE